MQVTLLGPVSAEAGGTRLPLGGRKQRAVFALLALNANRTVSLDRLVFEIWRDEPPARATLALQSYISRLRRVLADADDAARILTRPPGWLLELPARQVDAVRFVELLEAGRAHLGAARPAEAGAQLRAALDLWTGDPLADLDDDLFATEDAARLREARLEATEQLLEADLACGSNTAVVASARDVITRHPYRERAWCALILALYRAGRQADALATVRELRETLAEGLGLDPSPEAQQLEDMILRHDPGLAELGPIPVLEPAAARVPGLLAKDALVGRHHELDTVVAVVSDANHGAGRLLVIDGPAGMGKSTMLRRLQNSVAAVGGIVLRASGVGAAAAPALWPWVTIVRQLGEARPDVLQAALDGPAGAALAVLDPSLDANAGPTAAPDAGLGRTRIYRAVIDILAAARKVGPLAVILDDAHWLDTETLDLLAVAVADLVPHGLLFAVAMRPEESVAAADAVTSLASAMPDSVRRLTLAGLDTVDVRRVVARIAGIDPHQDVVAAIGARTAGNPFFVAELTQLLVSERRLDRDSVYAALPTGVRDVLRRRLDRLPDETIALLTVIAVLGRAVDLDLLTAVSGVAEDAALDGCEAAVLSGLLVDDVGTGGFALCHDLVRQTLDELLSSARRIRLHARIAQALQSGGKSPANLPPQRIVEIAHHLTRAAPVVGPTAALRYLLMAADDAITRSAPATAVEFLATAQDLAGRIKDPVERAEREYEIWSRRAAGHLVAPAVDLAPASIPDTAEAPRLDPGRTVPLDPDAPADWWNTTALLIASGHNQAAAEAAEAAVRDEPPPGAAVAVYFLRGVAALQLGHLDLADSSLVRTNELTTQLPGGTGRGLFPLAGTATVLQAAVAVLRGDDDLADELLEQARTVRDVSITQAVAIEFWTAWCHAQRGRHEDAVASANACLLRDAQVGGTFSTPWAKLILAWAAAMRGDHAMLDRAAEAQDDYLAYGMRYQLPTQLVLRAEAHAHHGEPERARALLGQARELAAITGEATLGPRLQAFIAQLLPA